MSLLPLIQSLKTSFDNLSASSQETMKADYYRAEILPLLLQLRKTNRLEKNNLEAKHSQIRNLNQRLASLQQSNENLLFEAACLGSPTKEIELVEEEVRKLDHQGRMNYLDEEEERRKDLQKNLASLNEELKELEKLYSQSAEQFNEVKPHIKQLLDVTRTKICSSQVST